MGLKFTQAIPFVQPANDFYNVQCLSATEPATSVQNQKSPCNIRTTSSSKILAWVTILHVTILHQQHVPYLYNRVHTSRLNRFNMYGQKNVSLGDTLQSSLY